MCELNSAVHKTIKIKQIKFIPKVIIKDNHLSLIYYMHENIQPNVAKCQRKACVCNSKNRVDI